MTFLEAKALAGAETVIKTYEEATNTVLPEYLKEETRQEWIANMKPVQVWLDKL